MTKTVLKSAAGVILLLPMGCQAAMASSALPAGQPILSIVQDLGSAQAWIQKLETKLDQAIQQKQTCILGSDGSQMIANEAGMDRGILRNYQAEAEDDISYLREHWAFLTPEEKTLVERAALAREEDNHGGP
jgi:hypothetical protein